MPEHKITEQDIEAIAERLTQRLQQTREAWIDPEEHYRCFARMEHLNDDDVHSLSDLLKAYRAARGLFWKAFFGFAIVGAIVAAAVGMGFKH